MLQTILQTGPEPVFEPTFNRTVLRPVSEELSRKGFLIENITQHEATYRDKDRYISFEMEHGRHPHSTRHRPRRAEGGPHQLYAPRRHDPLHIRKLGQRR